jgi:hypothetical protein
MDDQERRRSAGRRGRLRTFALGGIVGAAGTIATARRLRRSSRRPRDAPAGLAAFEDAPCFHELVDHQGAGYRDGGEIERGRSKPE